MRSDRAPARRSLGLLLVAATVALVAGWSPPALAALGGSAAGRASAPSPGACTDPSGVTVVVDFGAFGGGTEVRCAGWPVADGYDALRRAGFTITDTARFPGLLCRIDGLPSDQACVAAPPPDAHWGYSYADRGGTWTYSSQGARARAVQPGDVEGWAFGKAARPAIAPPAPPPTTTAAPPPPAPPAPEPAAPAPDPAAPPRPTPSTVATGEPADGDQGRVEEDPAGSPAPTSESGAGGTAGDDRLAAGPGDTRLAASQQEPGPGSGSPLPAVATAALVAALVGGGVALRRRREAGA